MPLFKNTTNGLHVLWVKPLGADGHHENDPNMTVIESFEDLPDFDYLSINMPPEIVDMGKRSMYHYFRAFMPEYEGWKEGQPFLMWQFPSNFPKVES